MKDINSKTDQELVKPAIQDDKYFEYIIERYERKLSRYVSRIYFLNVESIEYLL